MKDLYLSKVYIMKKKFLMILEQIKNLIVYIFSFKQFLKLRINNKTAGKDKMYTVSFKAFKTTQSVQNLGMRVVEMWVTSS